jgi:putative phosphoribosyl transferase
MVSGWKLEDAGIDQEITMAGIKQLERRELEVKIPAAGVFLTGNLMMPVTPRGVVLFAHGSGSSRFSPRNRFVAGILLEAGFAALLMDLLTTKEEAIDLQTRQLRFDIRLLAGRLFEAIDWLGKNPATAGLVVGCFGASTGAAAALIAAAERPAVVRAVVSRGGRPDLAGEALRQVKAPTLLIVGGDDQVVIELNRQALAQLAGEKQLEIVPGATHLFEEPGTLEAAARLTSNWFGKHL